MPQGRCLKKPLALPAETVIGVLGAAISDSSKPYFQPLKESYGILPSMAMIN